MGKQAQVVQDAPVVREAIRNEGRHFCMLQSMKQVSHNKHFATLKCKGCGSPITVKLSSSVYKNWQNLTGKAKEEKRNDREDKR